MSTNYKTAKTIKTKEQASFYSTSPSGISPLAHGCHRPQCLPPDSVAVECDLSHLQS